MTVFKKSSNAGIPQCAEDYVSNQTPETHLLAAILDRAFRDLSPLTGRKDREDAIFWFEYTDDSPFSFKFTCNMLNLSARHIKYLLDVVIRAREFHYGEPITDDKVEPFQYRRSRMDYKNTQIQ